MRNHRYPGANPFSHKESSIFFGRERDIDHLLELITLEHLIVLYSKSGAGKSSLLQAGILPRQAELGNILPVLIRFGAFHADAKTVTPVHAALNAINPRPVSFLNRLLPEDNSLWHCCKSLVLRENLEGVLLIFDQFEELFSYHEELILEFKTQLAELINTEVPQRFRSFLEAQFTQSDARYFSEDEIEALHHPMGIKILFSIRSDRMSLLNNLTDRIPNILKICFELDALTVEQAEEAILNPAYMKNPGFISPPFDYEDDAIEGMLDFLTKGRTQKIETFQLQILCQHLENKVIRNKVKHIRKADIQNIDSIYENYYEDQIDSLPGKQDQIAARKLIEEGLIFEEEERRLSLYEGQIYKTYGFTPELLQRLTDTHIIRAEPSMKGGYSYELSHDTLIAPVLKAKKKRLVEEKKAEEARILAEREAEVDQLRKAAQREKKKKNKAFAFAIFSSSLAILALASTLFAFQQYRTAQNAKQQIENEKTKVEELNSSLNEALQRRIQSEYESMLEQGKRLQSDNQFPEAITTFRSAIALVDSSNYQIDNGAAGAKAALEACAQLWEVAEQYAGYMIEGERLVSQGPDYYQMALKKYAAARDLNVSPVLTQGAQNRMDEIALEVDRRFAQYKERGELFLQRGKVQAACEALRTAANLKPGDAQVRKLLKQNNCS